MNGIAMRLPIDLQRCRFLAGEPVTSASTHRAAGDTGNQYLDNQALADLIAGRLPMSSQPRWSDNGRGVHLQVRDEVSQNRQTTIDRLRRSIPAGASRTS